MNDMLVAVMLSNIEQKKALENLLTEIVYRLLDLEKKVGEKQ